MRPQASPAINNCRRRRPWPGVALALVWVLLFPGFASASVVVNNQMQGDVAGVSAGPQFFAYHQGGEVGFDLQADFDQGIYLDTEIDDTGTLLQLAGAPMGAWWDTAWGARRCFDVDNQNAQLDEYQVRFVFDSSADAGAGLITTGDSYRAVAADDMTELDFWVESGVGTTETVVWVQLDLAATSQTSFCLYFDNDTVPSASSQAEVFSYTTAQRLYYTVSHRFNGSGGANGTLDVVSFVDGNEVTVDGVAMTINRGIVQTFTNVTPDSVVTTTGPIAGRGRGDGMDALIPASFAGTDMLFPTNRGTQRWSMVSPSGASADVVIYNGTVQVWSGTVGSAVVTQTADVGNNRSGTITSTNGVPIIVTHTSTQRYDALVVPPYFGDDIFGVRSRYTYVGVFDGPGDVDIWRSDGTIQSFTGLVPGSVSRIYDGADLDGNGTAVRFTNMTGVTGGLQQADRNGLESTAYLPERLLENEYFLPTNADYIAFACPVSATINVGAVQVPCGSLAVGFPGHGHIGPTPAGTRIWSDNGANFYAYYEDDTTQDETNLFGMKSAQSGAAIAPTVSGGSVELVPQGASSGSWTSPVIDTSAVGTNVFGLLGTIGDLPPGTTAEVRVARGATAALALAAPFLGPDSTAATSFAMGEAPLPFAWDFGDPYVVIRIDLATTTPGVSPVVDSLSLGYDLPEVFSTSLHTVTTAGANSERDWVLRVWTEDAVLTSGEAQLIHVESLGVGLASNATVALAGADQVVISAGALVQAAGAPVGIGPGLAHNVAIDTQNMIGADVEVAWQGRIGGTGILVQHRMNLMFT